MIVLLTAPGHNYTLRSLIEDQFGVPVPRIRCMAYDDVLKTRQIPWATYIFADIERLDPYTLRSAANMYRTLKSQGVRCLNDPALVMSRVELLTNLHVRAGNPIRAYRADAHPKPVRFPVFLRCEDDHEEPSPTLYDDQEALDAALVRLRREGTPLRGLLVLEKVEAKYSDTLWAKWGTWRIGERIIVEHIAVDRQWMVKHGRHEYLTESVVADELDAVATNRFEASMRPIFDIGGIEYGRVDHAVTPDGMVVFEINTNPFLCEYVPDPWVIRRETQMIARKRLSEALEAIDAGSLITQPQPASVPVPVPVG